MGILGNLVDRTGTLFNLPEWGISEQIAGGPTVNTMQPIGQDTLQNYVGVTPAFSSQEVQGPVRPTNYQVGSSGPGGAYPQAPVQTQQPQQPTQQPSYTNSLNNYFNQLNSFKNEQSGLINDKYNSYLGDINTQRESTESQLGQSEEKAKTNKASSLRDIQQDLMNSLQAGQVYLGGLGAGSSSAVGRLSGALSKAANRNATSVENQYNDVMGNIENQRVNLKSMYDQEINNLNRWKTDQLASISSWVQEQQANQSGANLDAIRQRAFQELANIDARSANLQSMLDQWAIEKSGTLDQAIQNLQQTQGINFNPTAQMASRGLYGGYPINEEQLY